MGLPSQCSTRWRLTPLICKHVQVKTFQLEVEGFLSIHAGQDSHHHRYTCPTAESTEISITNEASEKTIQKREQQVDIPVNPGGLVELDAGNYGATIINSGEKSNSQMEQKNSDDGSRGWIEEIDEGAWSCDKVDATSEGIPQSGGDDSNWDLLDEADDI